MMYMQTKKSEKHTVHNNKKSCCTNILVTVVATQKFELNQVSEVFTSWPSLQTCWLVSVFFLVWLMVVVVVVLVLVLGIQMFLISLV